MPLLLKLLVGSLGPYIAGGVAVLLALSVATAGIQSARLKHAKADLANARAALIDPSTRKTWESEARVRERDLTTCQGNVSTLEAAQARQNAAVEALRADSDARLAQSAKAASDARAVAESYRQASRDVLGATAGADKCEAADRLIMQEAGR